MARKKIMVAVNVTSNVLKGAFKKALLGMFIAGALGALFILGIIALAFKIVG